MSRYAVLDIGTNSIKFFAARLIHGRLTVLEDAADVCRLGEGLAETGELSEAAMDRALTAVKRFSALASELGVEQMYAVGTEALRRAENAEEFVDLVKRRAKLRVHVIDGNEEARLSTLAVKTTLGLPADRTVVIADIGGGSTELVRLEDGAVTSAESLPLGVRTLTDAHVRRAPLSEDDGDALAAAVSEALGDRPGPADMLVGVGGTASTLAAVHLRLAEYDPGRVQGLELSRDDIEMIYERLAAAGLGARRRMRGLPADRADVMPAGAAVALALTMAAGCEALTVCACGLRQGVFHDRFATRI